MNRAALGIGLAAADLAAAHVDRRSTVRIGAQADRAAPAACGIAGELCIAGNGDGSAAFENGTAVQTGRVSGDRCISGNSDRAVATHINGTAAGIVAVHGSFISGNRAALQPDGSAGSGEERTAVFGSVVLDGAAVHIEGAASDVRLVRFELPENGTAVVSAVVAGNFAAVHVEHALVVIQGNGAAAAAFCDLSAGELAAVHIKSAGVEVNAAAAPDILRRALDGAAALTVAEDKTGVVSHLELLFSVGGQRLAVQAQVQSPAIDDQVTAEGGVACQIDIGDVVRIGYAGGAVPRLVGHVCVAGVVARIDAAAADAVGVARLHGDARISGQGCFAVCRRVVLTAALGRRSLCAADGAV